MWIVFIGGIEHENFSSLSHELKNAPSETETNLNSMCRLQDSLVLVDIYNSANGPGWTNPWNLNIPMDNWDGVVLNSEGCLEELRLSNRNLDGTVSTSIGNLNEISLLHLDNNNLQGAIPGELGNLTELKTLFIDNNNFTGTIPDQIGNITSLNTLFIDNNDLTGAIPITFLGMNNLTNLEFFGNRIDSVPDLSPIQTLIVQNNKLKMSDNALTFDDILPNISSSLGDHYIPQDSVFQEITYFLSTGDDFDIDLGIDKGITNSEYRWFKNGTFFTGPLNSPKLPLGPIDWIDAGVYHCQITNPNAPLLTLYSRPITINVSCGISFGDLDGSYCDDQDFWVNGNLYNQNNPTGTELMSVPDQYGCDSVLNINLQFLSSTSSTFQQEICSTESFVINGVTYDINNLTGTEILTGFNGCDSIVTIILTEGASAENFINETICSTASISINGTTYDTSNPDGVEILPNQSHLGCDSTIYVDLTFYALAEGNFNEQLCAGASILIGGILFNESNPSGTATLPNQSFQGCDSTVLVNLTFASAITEDFSPTLCLGESRVINGTTYNSSNPTGSELFPQGSFIGCDSIVNINLSFHGVAEGFINETLCDDESIIVNGTTYDINNPSGAVTLSNGSFYGCDSTVFVNLSFTQKEEVFLNELLCPGEFRQINGVTYDVNNPSGVAILPAQQLGECDSTLFINLTYLPLAEGFINENKCAGEVVEVEGTTFDINNPMGAVQLNGQGFNGCDSTVYVNLVFNQTSEGFVNELLCIGEARIVNGVTYDVNNPMGAEFFPNQNHYGCDSMVYINLTYVPVAENFINNTLCSGSNMLINGNTYNESNPSGTEFLPAMGFNGCDSTIFVDLTFTNIVINDRTELLCTGSSIVVNNNTYDANNPIGTETFPMGSYIGCDSIVEINLSFYESTANLLDPILCEGDFIEVNGTTYDQSNLTGIETLVGAAFLGCDSIVEINLSYHEIVSGTLTPTVCDDETYSINGTTYDINNPIGTEILPGMASNGCDSIVSVSLNFYEIPIGNFNPSVCANSSISFNGTEYNMSNPTGTEILANQSFNGCDSMVNVQIEFVESIEETITDQLCVGQSIQVNGTTYNLDNPNGVETFTSINGCDSIVTINLTFGETVTGDLIQNICPNEEVIINGNIYNANNLSGSELIVNGSWLGCDSIVNISLNLQSASNTFYNQTLCEDQIVELHGQIFDVNNPSGIIELDDPNAVGCDSFLVVELVFNPASTGTFSPTVCEDESIEIDGIIYDINNPTGSTILQNANYLSCDSTVNISLSFYEIETGLLEQQLCTGENIVINGNTYDASNPIGTEILENANYLGCDSLLEISIQFVDETTSSFEATICEGETYTFDNQSLATSGAYTQTIQNGSTMGCDSIVTLNLTVENPIQLGIADAGIDEMLCENEVMLNANAPSGTIGIWSTNSTITIQNPTDPNLLLENIPVGTHEMTWTLSSSNCGEYSSDNMLVSVPELPEANEDAFDVIGNDGSENILEVTSNDNMNPTQNLAINILSQPTSGSASISPNGNIEYIADPEFLGTVEIEYEICDEFCPDNCSTSFVTINVDQMPIDEVEVPNFPNAITANDDGINDEWIIDILETNPEKYPNNQLLIINRWGETVFEASPYLNDWSGNDATGLPLPTGTYYYTLILDLGDGEIYKGDLTVLR